MLIEGAADGFALTEGFQDGFALALAYGFEVGAILMVTSTSVDRTKTLV